MPLATATTPATTATATIVSMMSPKTIFPCNACHITYQTSQMQRAHMREAWHVYNIKRRMASLPPISVETYSQTVATNVIANKHGSIDTKSSSSSDESSDDETILQSDLEDQSNQCLFCSNESDNAELNLDHMRSDHGLYLPHVNQLASLETMIGYLRTLINRYKECLYCGTTRHSAKGARQHMLDKGHCMINLEREPELLEFWDFSDSSNSDPESDSRHRTTITAPSDEHFLPSGKVVESKSKARESRISARRNAQAARETSKDLVFTETPATTIESPSFKSFMDAQKGVNDRAVTVRDALGLIGVSDQQIRGLVTVERKMQRQQAVVFASRSWAGELGGRNQKHFKTKMNLRDG